MAKGYWISAYRAVHDPERLKAYAELAGPAVLAAGGNILARGGKVEAHEAGKDTCLSTRHIACCISRVVRTRQGMCLFIIGIRIDSSCKEWRQLQHQKWRKERRQR